MIITSHGHTKKKARYLTWCLGSYRNSFMSGWTMHRVSTHNGNGNVLAEYSLYEKWECIELLLLLLSSLNFQLVFPVCMCSNTFLFAQPLLCMFFLCHTRVCICFSFTKYIEVTRLFVLSALSFIRNVFVCFLPTLSRTFAYLWM